MMNLRIREHMEANGERYLKRFPVKYLQKWMTTFELNKNKL